MPRAARATWLLIRVRQLVAAALLAGGAIWALVRGVEFYGVSPANLYYDLDQPPLLLVMVAAWLLYRSRRR